MRFLLHPPPAVASSSSSATSSSRVTRVAQAAASAVVSNVPKNAAAPSQTSRVDTTLSTTSRSSNNFNAATSNNNNTKTIVKRWGQQCSPTCGCVLRMEAQVDFSNSDSSSLNRIVNATYTAKSVLSRVVTTTATTTASKNDSLHKQKSHCPSTPYRTAILTNKGRPMFTTCTCPTLHTLSQRLMHYFNTTDSSWDRLVTEFHISSSLRSSEDFRRAVLVAQELPRQDTHCFDIVEDAVTALLQGYLPAPRRRPIQQQQQQRRAQRLRQPKNQPPSNFILYNHFGDPWVGATTLAEDHDDDPEQRSTVGRSSQQTYHPDDGEYYHHHSDFDASYPDAWHGSSLSFLPHHSNASSSSSPLSFFIPNYFAQYQQEESKKTSLSSRMATLFHSWSSLYPSQQQQEDITRATSTTASAAASSNQKHKLSVRHTTGTSTSGPHALSTLHMYDQMWYEHEKQQQQQHLSNQGKQRQSPSSGAVVPPKDWESYVDEELKET